MPTTTVKTIGSGGGRDYSSIATWEADAPANLVTSDVVYKGECYNDSEFSLTAEIGLAGSTSDSTRYKWLTAASGESFADNANKTTNALKYNQSNGVGLAWSGSGYLGRYLNIGESYARVTRLQISFARTSGGSANIEFTASNTFVEQCILERQSGDTQVSIVRLGTYGAVSHVRNCCIIDRTTGNGNGIFISSVAGSGSQFLMNTFARTSGTAGTSTGINCGGNYSRFKLENIACFGFNTCFSSGTYATGSDYNATDKSSTGTSGAHDLTSLTYSSQFENTSDSTRDLRAKGSGSLDGAGVTDLSTDIIDQTRGSPPTIGCWEVVAAGGDVTVNLTGVSATGAIGTASETGTANVSPTGVSATGAVGTVSVSTGADISVDATGVSATGSVGTVSVTGGATVSPTGVSATGSVGTATATGGATVTLSGTSATGAVGTVTVDTGGNVTVNTTGVSATGTVGDVSVTGTATVTLSGVQAQGYIGTVSFGEEVAAPTVTVAGTSGKGVRRPRKVEVFTVTIGGEEFQFLSMDAALAFVAKQQPRIERVLEEQARKVAKRILKAGKKAKAVKYLQAAKPAVVTVTGPQEYAQAISEVAQAIERDFDNALAQILSAEAEVNDIIDIVRYL